MEMIWEGFKLGLLLTIMVGPIFFAIIQTSVEQGFKAGAMVGAGIWISDILYILFVYYGVSFASDLIENKVFFFSTGIIGAAILMAIGIGTMLSKSPNYENTPNLKRHSTYFKLWTKGFLINTINPFTIFFWFSVMSTMVVNNSLDIHQALLFFGTIMITIISTDLLKALLAKKISTKLTNEHIQWTRKITGIILILFGLGLLVRVFIE